jgi:hypothetical protein
MTSDEAEGVRRGLLALRQNVVLLRDPEDSNSFYPVSFPIAPVSLGCLLSAFLVDPTCTHMARRRLLQRIALNTTTSYKALEQHWQDELLQLHNDYYHHRQVGLRCMQLRVLPTRRRILDYRSASLPPHRRARPIVAGRAVAAAVAPHAASADGCH